VLAVRGGGVAQRLLDLRNTIPQRGVPWPQGESLGATRA
jgi:hypothetical protein